MVLEQELASIFGFVLTAAGNPYPYYRDLPQDFRVPAAYFPIPEIITSGDTFSSYGAEYDWYIKFIHSETQEAYEIALSALTALKEARNLVPLRAQDGKLTGKGVRIKDPELRTLDKGVVQLKIRFVSRRPYNASTASRMRSYDMRAAYKKH